jgi:hypothetical protein
LTIEECNLSLANDAAVTGIEKENGNIDIRDTYLAVDGGGSVDSFGLQGDATVGGATLTIRNSLITADGSPGRGIAMGNRTILLDNVSITATGGTSQGVAWAGSLTIMDSELHASLVLNLFGGTANIANSMLDGAVNTTTGLTCVGAYNGSFVSLPSDCELP